MKRYIYILICSISLFTAYSCINEDTDFDPVETDGDYILLHVSAKGLQSRATIEDNAKEEAVSHLDVIIFNEEGDEKIYSERLFTDAPQGSLKLGMRRSDYLTENAKYFVYVIANSTHPASTFTDLGSINELHGLKQVEDRKSVV